METEDTALFYKRDRLAQTMKCPYTKSVSEPSKRSNENSLKNSSLVASVGHTLLISIDLNMPCWRMLWPWQPKLCFYSFFSPSSVSDGVASLRALE